MRRTILTSASLMIFLTITLAWARTHPESLEARQSVEAIDTPHGDDEAEAIVRYMAIAPPGGPGVGVAADYSGAEGLRHAWIVRFEVTKVLKGQWLPGLKLTIRVHSPSRDLGVSRAGQRGVLRSHRSGPWQGRYRFVAE